MPNFLSHCYFIPIVIIFLPTVIRSENDGLTRTKQGSLLGIQDVSRNGRKFYSYRGIRYAETPVRFEVAKPYSQTWTDIRNASACGARCPQMYFTPEPVGDEDCLFLNIYTPTLEPEAGLPVMVWIHGGGLQFGSSEDYEPHYFMDQDVVLVTINYRLGLLGFLSSGDSIIPGNFGMKDQQLALKWVKENIERFGGLAQKVTIFGESGGAGAVSYHMLSPSSQGLFQRAIALSGSAISPWAYQKDPLKNLITTARRAGCPYLSTEDTLKCLTKLSAYRLVEIQRSFLEFFEYPEATFTVTAESSSVDNSFITDTPYNLMKKGDVSKVPYMTGITSHEGLYFMAPLILWEHLRQELNSNFSHVASISLMYEDDDQGTKSQQLLKAYTGKSVEEFKLDNWEALEKMFGDRYVINAVLREVELLSKHTKIYTYLFSYRGERSFTQAFGGKEIWGVSHGDDLLYLFKNMSGMGDTVDPQSLQMSQNFIQCLVSFANNGKPPGWGNERNWEPITRSQNLWYQMDKTTALIDINTILSDKLSTWEALFPMDKEQSVLDSRGKQEL